MNILISPKKLQGTCTAPSSKSFMHRILCASLLAKSKTIIKFNEMSSDILATIDCITKIGAKIKIDNNFLEVFSKIPLKNHVNLNANESGTTARFLIPIASALCSNFSIEGNGRLPIRPFSPICEELRNHGVLVDNDFLPIKCSGTLKSGIFVLPGDISTQFISGLLFALPILKEDSKIILTSNIQGFNYIQMTLDILKMFGIKIFFENSVFFVSGNQEYKSPNEITCEGDWSNSAFWLCANFLGSKIDISNLNYNSSQGDKMILNYLNNLNDIDASNIPDLVPILAVFASVQNKFTRIYNAKRLRIKESDRLQSTTNMLNNLGAKIVEKEDCLEIYGQNHLIGGEIDSFNDHRIVMSASIAATICKNNVIIKNAEAVNKSYPNFFNVYTSLGGEINVI